MQNKQNKVFKTVCVCFHVSFSVKHPFRPNSFFFILRNVAYAAQGWHLSCSVFWRTRPRKRKTPSPHRPTPVMRGLEHDREPEGKAWGMTPADDRLARMSVHTQQQMMQTFLQYNVQVKF